MHCWACHTQPMESRQRSRKSSWLCLSGPIPLRAAWTWAMVEQSGMVAVYTCPLAQTSAYSTTWRLKGRERNLFTHHRCSQMTTFVNRLLFQFHQVEARHSMDATICEQLSFSQKGSKSSDVPYNYQRATCNYGGDVLVFNFSTGALCRRNGCNSEGHHTTKF